MYVSDGVAQCAPQGGVFAPPPENQKMNGHSPHFAKKKLKGAKIYRIGSKLKRAQTYIIGSKFWV